MTEEASPDAERIATAISMASDWNRDDVQAVVKCLDSIACDINETKNYNPGWGIERTLKEIASTLDSIAHEIGFQDDVVVDVSTLAAPIKMQGKQIVAWATTANGDTWPMYVSAEDPRPTLVRYWPDEIRRAG